MDKMTLDRLIKIDRELHSIREKISLDMLGPLNLEEERKKFLSGKIKNPNFKYAKIDVDFQKYISTIRSLDFRGSYLDVLFKKYAEELILTLSMFANIGKDRFSYYSARVYGKPDSTLLMQAKKLSRIDEHRIFESPRDISTREAIGIFRSELMKLGFKWNVSSKPIVANAIVLPSKREFMVKEDYHFSKRQIQRFVAHEIYTHILRAECGLLQPFRLFSTGLAAYEPTEEGLALYKEKIIGVMDRKTLKGYAGRVLAIEKALNSSFRDTFNLLNGYFPKNQAWNLSVRVKRGLCDTSKKGAFTKDLIYLQGYYQILNYVQQGGSIKELHYGKIGWKDVDTIKKIEDLRDPGVMIKNEYTRLLW